jgi:hypothetical protein
MILTQVHLLWWQQVKALDQVPIQLGMLIWREQLEETGLQELRVVVELLDLREVVVHQVLQDQVEVLDLLEQVVPQEWKVI